MLFIDTCVGGYWHDLTIDSVRDELIEYAAMDRCIGVLFTPPCSTWSAMRHVPKEGKPNAVRDLDHLLGIPDGNDDLPKAAVRANAIVESGIAIVRSAHSASKPWLVENPVSRAAHSPFRIKGREKHACLFDHPPMVELAVQCEAQSVFFDQGAVGAESQKTTQLLCSPGIHPHTTHSKVTTRLVQGSRLISSSSPDPLPRS